MGLQMSLEFLDSRAADMTNPNTEAVIPDLRQCAILLDIVGTLLDFAPSPRQVRVPADLRGTLARLKELPAAALAQSHCRSAADIDPPVPPL